MKRTRIIIVGVIILALFLVLIQMSKSDKRASVTESLLVQDPTQQIEFDELKWKTEKGWGYAYRNEMLDDLMSDGEIRKLKKSEIMELLGKPTREDGDYLFYRVDQKRALFFPLHTKTLVIHFLEDGSIDWMKIHE